MPSTEPSLVGQLDEGADVLQGVAPGVVVKLCDDAWHKICGQFSAVVVVVEEEEVVVVEEVVVEEVVVVEVVVVAGGGGIVVFVCVAAGTFLTMIGGTNTIQSRTNKLK